MLPKNYLSLTVQGLYVLTSGLLILFATNTVLPLFGFAPTTEIWVKVVGILGTCFSILYYYINKYGSREIVFSTVLGRLLASACFVIMVLMGEAPTALLLFGIIDTATAIWTWFEMQKAPPQ
jgi:hypothetical protein